VELLPPDLPPDADGQLPWRARLLWWWPVKAAGLALGMTVFFAGYFWVLRHPRHPPFVMPRMAVDEWIAFAPRAALLYVSLWLYVSLVPSLMDHRRQLISYAVAAVTLAGLGLGIFYVWPTAVPRPAADWPQGSAFGFLKTVDASGNACPSLHVAFAVFTAIWLGRLLPASGRGHWLRAINWFWCIAILYSTVATRQHVALDVAAGAALGAAVAWAHLAWLARGRRQPTR
jgi:membrane-associated phospholipid phosphatase